MVVPPVWMFIIAGAAAAVVVSVGLLAYEEYQKTKVRVPKRRKPRYPCTICTEANATVKFLPCGHMLMCRSCFREFSKEKERCERCPHIMCRAPINDIKYCPEFA